MSLVPHDFGDRLWPQVSRYRDPFFDFPRYPSLSQRWGLHDPASGWPSLRDTHSSWLLETRKRIMEMEQKFEDFMKKVDGRFSGMLSLVDVNHGFDSNLPIPVQHEGKPTEKEIVDKANYRIDVSVQDFQPEEVTVKVADGKVLVHAKRESKNEDNGMYAYTFREFKRSFALPDGVKTEDVKSSLSNDGILKIECPHDGTPARLAIQGEIPIAVDHAAKA